LRLPVNLKRCILVHNVVNELINLAQTILITINGEFVIYLSEEADMEINIKSLFLFGHNVVDGDGV
jgi:hypothetical protein